MSKKNCPSVGLLVPSITFERIELFTLIWRFWSLLVFRFQFFKQNDILPTYWGGGEKETGTKKNDVKNGVIYRFRVFLVHRFRFYKQNDILTKNWGGGKKQKG